MRGSAAVVLLAAGLVGCVISHAKPLPVPAPPADAGAPLRPLSPAARQLLLKVIVVDLPVGHEFGEVAWGHSGRCFRQSPLVNTQGRFDLELKNYGDVFTAAMKKHGYSVEDETEVFQDAKERVADLQIAAKLVDATLNECFPRYDENKLDVKGTAYLKVAWAVYSPVEKKVLATITTEGSTRQEIRSTVGEPGLLRAALADAAERLAESAAFRDIVDPPSGARPAAAATPRIVIRRAPAYTGELKRNVDAIRRSVATVTSNRGAGSGFVVSDDGKVITAEHVVAGSKFVKITTSAGKECYGEVLASSKQRDLALVGVECPGLAPLPIARERLVEGSEVFAIGTPLSGKLSFSVTKGVVSGLRTVDDLRYIQSDVTILPGSSGGPLLDASGNAVGVATGGVAVQSAPVGVNFFVPIEDLEKYLPVTLE